MQADTHQLCRSKKKALEDFSLFAKVDLQLAKNTIITYRSSLSTFFSRIRNPITEDSIRVFLSDFIEDYPNKSTYSTMLKALKCYFKKYLKSEITDSFRFPKIPYSPKRVPTKEQLQEFYQVLPSLKKRALFLLFASSGLRRNEMMSVKVEDLDLDGRIIIPAVHSGNTKRYWIGFFNEEAKEVLHSRCIMSLGPTGCLRFFTSIC